MQSQQPIGFFDSGVGGTSIWKEVHRLLPDESTVYLADSKNAPYGERTRSQIIALSIRNTELLLKHNCKLIVVACNTATTNAIEHLRKSYDLPFIGIEPAIKPAALHSKSGVIGILATKGTLSSSLFHQTMRLHTSGIKTVEQVGDGLVPLIEAGKIYTGEMKELLQGYLRPMLEANIDKLVLGCTHYPYLIPVLKELLPARIEIVDSGAAVAKQTKAILQQQNLLEQNGKKPFHHFYTNKDKNLLSLFLKDVSFDVQIQFKDF
ncbi:glutamate racemase [Flavobacteriaceae bacterium M23B6Z8]